MCVCLLFLYLPCASVFKISTHQSHNTFVSSFMNILYKSYIIQMFSFLSKMLRHDDVQKSVPHRGWTLASNNRRSLALSLCSVQCVVYTNARCDMCICCVGVVRARQLHVFTLGLMMFCVYILYTYTTHTLNTHARITVSTDCVRA